AQGQSLEKVIVDLESCQGMEAPYVMVSRATSLDGLLILHPFQQKRITCALSQDAQAKKSRLHQLLLQTLEKFGDTDESKQVQLALSTVESQDYPIEMSFVPHSNQPEEPFTLLQCLQRQDSHLYEAHPNHVSPQTSNPHIVGSDSTEAFYHSLMLSGNFSGSEVIYNLHHSYNITVDKEVCESRPMPHIHKKPYLTTVVSQCEIATSANAHDPTYVLQEIVSCCVSFILMI
ncbi:hypothetical protein L208DRAFT_1259677, partial [Tricholoma matsutake]